VVGQQAAVAALQGGLQLQGLDCLVAGHVLGGEGLGAGAGEELLVETAPQQRRDEQAQQGDHPGDRHRDQAELPRVDEHDRDEDAQEGDVLHQGHGGAGEEFADRFDALQAGDDGAGGALLEPRHGQAQQVAEHRVTEHGVDAAAGVQDEVLADPRHAAGEQHEHHQGGGDHDQGAHRVVHQHLVDDHLGEQRCAETDDLDGERGQQYLAPDARVAHHLAPDGGEAERAAAGFGVRGRIVGHVRCFGGGVAVAGVALDDPGFDQVQLRFAAGGAGERFGRARRMDLGAPAGVAFDQDGCDGG